MNHFGRADIIPLVADINIIAIEHMTVRNHHRRVDRRVEIDDIQSIVWHDFPISWCEIKKSTRRAKDIADRILVSADLRK
jgi:hypothetical protein